MLFTNDVIDTNPLWERGLPAKTAEQAAKS
jgi:hypothetical protein